jgi:GNAT superfamily N-acetyltransferase
MRGIGAVCVLLAILAGESASLLAQATDVTAYGLNVATYASDSPFAKAAFSDFQRARVMLQGRVGRWRYEAAYEHTALITEDGSATPALLTPGATGSSGDWIDLGGTIHRGDHLTWRHRFDRLVLAAELGESVELVVGRQPVSWATTLIFTPADPFSPFDPSDPFREYRIGVDAARLRIYPGPLSEIDIVVRPADFGQGTRTTALARGKTSVGGWDVGGWAGIVHDELAAAGSLSATIGDWAVRAEGALRAATLDDGSTDPERERTVVRFTVGVDRSYTVRDRDLYVIVEYQRDGFGAGDTSDLLEVAVSDAARRGELQALGRDQSALQLSYQVHPLANLNLLTLLSLSDGSALYAPGLSVDVTRSASLRFGAFLTSGASGLDGVGGPRSEYGTVPTVAYAALGLFF